MQRLEEARELVGKMSRGRLFQVEITTGGADTP